MKHSIHFLYSFVLILLLVTGCASSDTTEQQKKSQQQVELTVSAAASLQDALTEITANFTKDHPNVKINYNFGSSGALQQQISQGAPVDLFFSAAVDKFDQLIDQGLMDADQSVDLVGNEIVLVVPKDADLEIDSFETLSKAGKISIGTPESVPAGTYAKETLEKLNLWSSVQAKMVYAKDVRQVLTYVETNNVDAGMVYKTDALISDKVEIVATADEASHAPIVYPLGVIKNSSHAKEAQQFFEYLQSESSMKILEKFGFVGLK